MIPADATFDDTYPFPPRFSSAPGFRMHYIDEGQADAPVVLMLHGEPTWSYLFRRQIMALRKRFRVIAVDHMGFGKSETPSDRSYWLQDHISNLEALVLELDVRGISLVMHDFGGPVGMGLAVRHPDRIAAVVSVNAPTPLGQPDLLDVLTANGTTSPWFQWIVNAHNSGDLEPILQHLDYNILSTLKLNGFEDNSIITPTWIKAYGAAFGSPEECRGAIGWALGFATGQHVFEQPTPAIAAQLANTPALAVWGTADSTLDPKHFLPLFSQAFPSGRIEELPDAGHYSPEDAPERVAQLIAGFLA
ncbi:alpha/beta fold hydrolase [Leifsonia sp. NPDC080035]|uniref:Alpha/beta fold hydrolase n=1 Tax=Leifsonia sp. NPDC080035 TaxID=3143936 RepID=A0AAU7GFG7_9MICO